MGELSKVTALGTKVYVTGTRNHWDVQIPMSLDGEAGMFSVRTQADQDFMWYMMREDARKARDFVLWDLAKGTPLYVVNKQAEVIASFRSSDFYNQHWEIPSAFKLWTLKKECASQHDPSGTHKRSLKWQKIKARSTGTQRFTMLFKG